MNCCVSMPWLPARAFATSSEKYRFLTVKNFLHRWGNVLLQRPAADRLTGRITHPAFSGILVLLQEVLFAVLIAHVLVERPSLSLVLSVYLLLSHLPHLVVHNIASRIVLMFLQTFLEIVSLPLMPF